jgi:cytochrome P450
LYEELCAHKGYEDLESLKRLDACIKEGLRFRPPVALTGSGLVPERGLHVLDYFLPAGTLVTTVSVHEPSKARPLSGFRQL